MCTPEFLDESIQHWRYIRQGVMDEVDNIPESKLGFRATSEVKSVHELVQHILEGSMMMVGELTQEKPDFQRMSPPEFHDLYSGRAHEARGKAALLELLAGQLEEGTSAFAKLGADAMMGPVTNFDGSRWSRMQWFFHGMTEEMYHRGQIVTYARLLGQMPALTRKIRAAGG